MNGHSIICVLALVAGCSRAPEREPLAEPTADVAALFADASDHLLELAEDGWVVSRWADGTPEHEGDSLIWTGIAMGTLDCRRGDVLEAALVRMINDQAGVLYRHPRLKDRAASLDGALGLYWGIAQRVHRCPESLETWQIAMAKHAAAPAPYVVREFTSARDQLLHALGLRGAPSGDRLRALEAQVASWAGAVNAKHAACYRAHLGLLSLELVEASGGAISGPGRDSFCAATRGMDLPTVDHWCGRGDLGGWIAAWRPDEWEYRLQRCPAWEAADGKPGLSTPGLDRLVALRAVYQLP